VYVITVVLVVVVVFVIGVVFTDVVACGVGIVML